MAVDDLWHLRDRDAETGGRVPSKRYGRGKRWRVRFADDTGQKRERLFEKKVDADRFDANVRTDVGRGLYIDPAAGRQTVEQYAKAWRDAQVHRGSTAELMERTFRRHILPTLGTMQIAQVRRLHIQAWAKGVDLAPSTARIAFSYLVAMFGAAVHDRAIAVSPCVGITLPEIASAEHRIPAPEQVHAIAEAIPPRYRALVYLGAGCGLRHGEALGLEVEHIDFLRRRVAVVQQLTVTSGRSPYFAPVKTKTSVRTVDLPKSVAQVLARHIELFPPVDITVTDEIDRRAVKDRTARLLFTNAKGRPIHRASWSHDWSPAARSAGLPSRTGFHSLRHFYATALIAGGASVKTVQLALGHSTPMITLNTYVGHWPDQIDGTGALLDAALAVTSDAASAR